MTSSSSSSSHTHNLDIKTYSLDDIFDLFHLNPDFTVDHLKQAKKKVLMTHPDKSFLRPEYFIFYKKAYEVVYNYYNDREKYFQNAKIGQQSYNTEEFEYDQSIKNAILSHTQNETSPKNINANINKIYEDNFQKKLNESRNQWFKTDESIFGTSGTVSKSTMNSEFEKMKKMQQQMGLVKYGGVKDYMSCTGLSNTKCYDDEDDQECADNATDYISCDLFGKLKFDDIRKVHKDQTILAVDEMDYAGVKKWKNAEEYRSARGNQDLAPMNSRDADGLIESRRKQELKMAAERKYKEGLKMIDTKEKMNSAISQFLLLK